MDTTKEKDTDADQSAGQPASITLTLPEHAQFFRNLPNAKRFAIDIGGSLTKIAYYSTVSHRRIRYATTSSYSEQTHTSRSGKHPDPDSSNGETFRKGKRHSLGGMNDVDEEYDPTDPDFEYEVWEGARLHFIKFETKFIEECLDFVQKHLVGTTENMRGKFIKATGGGAYKYSQLIEDKLGLTTEKEDEVACLIHGANFLLKNVANEAFTFDRRRYPEYHFLPAGPVLFPYLLVNVGSGVSILKVESEDCYERIGGTATGGGTFWGLGTLLTGAKGFDELLKLAEQGDHRKVDMLVKDIYSGGYEKLGLPGDVIASSFGKAAHAGPGDFSPADVARSLLFTIANDIGQIASLYAVQHNLSRVYFGGYFLRNHPLSMHAVSFAIRYWSKEKVEALFLRHEGYLGAIGAFLKGTEELEAEKYSWQENFAGSSGFTAPPTFDLENGTVENGLQDLYSNRVAPWSFPTRISFEQLEIDRAEKPFGFFTLLSSESEYVPDTVDLTKDPEARDYWLKCFEGWVERIAAKAIESQPNSNTATERALNCRNKLAARLRLLHDRPCAFGTLTVRSLLDTIEHCLREFHFPDPYLTQKQAENACALEEFEDRINYLDTLETERLHEELIWGGLTGNVLDWGAKAVTNLLEGPDAFGFAEARKQLQQRPWLVDTLDEWLERLRGPPHRCVTIFVDNSGFDFVLGMLPLIREFLRRGTKVIVCANSNPAVNDMTFAEMVPILRQAASKCRIIREGLEQGYLIPFGSGQGSPCLDLCRVSEDLIKLVGNKETDLVIIEGMGRCIHTNLYAKFLCEVIKMAVIKNKWLAERLGGDMFSIIFSYEKPK